MESNDNEIKKLISIILRSGHFEEFRRQVLEILHAGSDEWTFGEILLTCNGAVRRFAILDDSKLNNIKQNRG